MKKFSIFFVLALSAGFLYFSQPPFQNSKIINYYYYQGQKFYLQERTDVVFVQLKENVSEQTAKDVLSGYPYVDLTRTNIKTNDNNFLSLRTGMNSSEYINFVNDLKQNEIFESVNYAYSPVGIIDNKTFYGMNDLLIIQFKPGYSKQQIDQINSSRGVEVVERIDVSGGETFLARVTQSADYNAMEMSNKYYEDGLVNYSEPSLYVTNVLCDTVNDPFYPQQWSLRNVGNNVPTNPPNVIADVDMDVDSAWNITKGDTNLIIAISDTGVDTTHPDISRVFGYDFANNDGNPNDDGNHGTACAGIVAAIGNNNLGVTGVAYRCKIMPVKIINSAGSIPGYHVAASGMIWAYQHGASVISCSWGFTGGNSSLLYNAINDAARNGRNGKGTVLCFASGNEDTSPMRFPSISDAEMVVVGGLAPCNKRKSPSDGCSSETWGASFGPTLDIVAPCVKIYTTDRVGTAGYSTTDYYNSFNGTSSATPNAAGVCALLISAFPNKTRKEIEAAISISAEKVGAYSYTTVKEYGNWNNEMGYGRINARLALAYLAGTSDMVKPVIYHDNPSVSSNDSTARLITAIIKDNSKIATGTNQPRLYYRVNGGSFSFLNASTISADTFKFTIPLQTVGTTIDYYFAAQDTASVPNMITLPVGGSGVNPPGTTAPATFFNYRVGKYKFVSSSTTPKVCTNNSFIYDTITISGITGVVTDVDVRINISNRDDQDVDLFLLRTVGQSELTTDNGSSGDSYVNTIFDDEASTPITSGTVPFTGRFRPETVLNVFDGQTVNGQWILRYTDDASTGFNSSLDSWTLEITYDVTVGITQTSIVPSLYSLSQNYPNPFNPATVISYGLPKNSHVNLTLYDVTGKEVSVLVNELQLAGTYDYTLSLNSLNLSSGVYFYKLTAGDFTSVKKMILIK
ncbi:MAG: S8 family peptidase [Ignavibacteria bacterium]|nr:S8 family peptidase [Ignavibacteria bacterium]